MAREHAILLKIGVPPVIKFFKNLFMGERKEMGL